MPYGLYLEERGWTCTVKIQLTPSYLGDGAVRCDGISRFIIYTNIYKANKITI